MQMDAGMDTGPMLAQAECDISREDTATDLHDRLAALGAMPLLQVLDALASGQAQPITQDNALATYAPKINKADAAISWNKPAAEIDQQIRAFNPWPVAYTHASDTVLRIHQARILAETSSQTPGTIVSLDKKGMSVTTGTHLLLIEQIQFPGAKAMSVADWLNAKRDQLHVNLVLQ